MSIEIITSRAFPLPPVTLDGEELIFRPIEESDDFNKARVYLSSAMDPVDAARIAALPNTVSLIANLGVGTDNIDFDAARARGIAVSNTPVVTEDTADLAFALILSACRQIGQNERFLRAGHWSTAAPLAALGTRVHGAKLGLVGFGAIGQAVARRARGFDMDILYWNRSAKPEAETETGAQRAKTLTELVSQADIVSLHTPLVPETRHIVDSNLLQAFKPGGVLVNTGRGPLIDEAALIKALDAGQLGAAGLDVFEREPEVSAGLLACERVVLTPHIGSATDACRKDIVMRGIANIQAFLSTGQPLDRVA